MALPRVQSPQPREAEAPALRLVPVPHCPVCGGIQRMASDGMAVRKFQGLHYIKHAAAGLGLSVEDLADRVKTFRCLSCDSYFCDPWLSRELASSLFTAGAPDHIAGWNGFEHWLYPSQNNLVQIRNQRLYAAVTKRTGALSSYAEFGCPFQGFLLEFKGWEASPSERVRMFASAIQRPPDVRWTKITRLHNAAQRWCGRLAVLGLRFRAWRNTLLAGGQSRPQTPDFRPVAALPHQRYLLTHDTTKGWGSNCVRYGATCRYFAHVMLGADVIPFEEAHDDRSRTFDLIGLFNTLDHTTSPVHVLRGCLGLACHVLIVTHSAAHAGKQHLYAFGDGFGAWLHKTLPGITVENLAAEADLEEKGDYNYLLLSRQAME